MPGKGALLWLAEIASVPLVQAFFLDDLVVRVILVSRLELAEPDVFTSLLQYLITWQSHSSRLAASFPKAEASLQTLMQIMAATNTTIHSHRGVKHASKKCENCFSPMKLILPIVNLFPLGITIEIDEFPSVI